MQSPLPPVLVSILEAALQNGATHVEIEPDTTSLWCGETRLGAGALPPNAFEPLVIVLRGHAQMTMEARSGHAVFHGPLGALPVDVEVHDRGVRLVFSRDADATRAEHTVNLAFREAFSLGADSLVFAPPGVGYFKGSENMAVAPLDSSLFPGVIDHVRKLGGGDDVGGAVVYGPNGASKIETSIAVRGGVKCAIVRFVSASGS